MYMQSKIKILFFQWKLVFGGTESALFDLLRMINKDEFDVTLFVMEPGGVWEQKFISAGIKVIGPYSALEASKSSIAEKEYIKRKKRIDKSINDYCIRLLDICTDEKWDIVVAYHPTDYRLAIFQKNAKTVFYLHMDPEHHVYLKNDLQIAPNYYKSFDRIIAVSNYAKNNFIYRSGIVDNISAHFNPIDSDEIKRKADKKTIIDVSCKYVCAVGRLSEQKGFERLIRIHKRIVNEGLIHRLIIVGEGELRSSIENTINETDTNNTVVLAGFQDNPYPIIKNSRFLVVSSFHEGLCMAAMEAIILGVPVVSTIPTINELSGDECCSIVTDVDDESLYQGMKKMLSDEELYQEAKSAAIRRSSFFDGQRMTEEVENEFKSLYYEKTNYRKRREYLRKEIKRVRKLRNRDFRHIPNRIVRSILGEHAYESFKSKIKK